MKEEVVNTEDDSVVEVIDETNPEPPIEESPEAVEEIDIEGVGPVALDELKKGYLRQSDYTRKTQEVAEQKRLIEEEIIKLQNSRGGQTQQVQQFVNQQQNYDTPTQLPPELAQNPFARKIVEMEQRMYDMALRNEVSEMKAKYDDFDVVKVLTIARDKGITNLDDAYKLHKASVPVVPQDTDKLREQIRAELLEELSNDKEATRTLISATDKKVQPTPKGTITSQENKIASAFGMSAKEYLKWKDGQ